ncbi:unnamed protein product [Lathyrus oleraceus]
MTGYITQRNNKILFSDSPTTRFLRCHPTDLLFLPFPLPPNLTPPPFLSVKREEHLGFTTVSMQCMFFSFFP